MADDLFGADQEDTFEFDPNKNYKEELVGEGKKYTDDNKLAYSRLVADGYIKRLETETAQMRQELQTRQRLEDIVTKLSSSGQTMQSPSNENNQNREQDGDKTPVVTGLTPEQAELLLENKLREKENLNKAIEGAKSIFGDDYKRNVTAETQKLGLDEKFVQTLARTNPDAFIRLLEGARKPKDEFTGVPSSSVNTTAFKPSVSSGRTQKYYQELKKADPKTYWSKSVQQQEYQDALKLGPAWFDA